MRISDWSSDVCSSDLIEKSSALEIEYSFVFQATLNIPSDVVYHSKIVLVETPTTTDAIPLLDTNSIKLKPQHESCYVTIEYLSKMNFHDDEVIGQIGRASSRERECQYV